MRGLALLTAVAVLASTTMGAKGTAVRYPSPIEAAVSPDGNKLYVMCEGTDEVVVLDSHAGTVVRRIPVGHRPKGFALSQNGQRLYVANSWSDSISEIDTVSLQVIRTFQTGFEPNAVIPGPDGKSLFVANRVGNDISVLDLGTGNELKRLNGGRGASYLAASPDRGLIYSTHIYPTIGAFRTPPQSEIAVIDAVRQVVVDRYPIPGAAGMFHVAMSADGRLGMAAGMRPEESDPLGRRGARMGDR